MTDLLPLVPPFLCERVLATDDAQKITAAKIGVWMERFEADPSLQGVDLRSFAADYLEHAGAFVEMILAGVEMRRYLRSRTRANV